MGGCETLFNERGEWLYMATEPTASDVMTEGVISIDADASVQEAAKKMRDNDIRSLVVVEEDEAVGMVVGRDIVYGTVAAGADPDGTTVRDIMTANLVTAAEEDNIEDIARAMVDNDISRVPIMRGENLVGMVTHTNLAQTWPSYLDLLEEESQVFSMEAAPGEARELFSGVCDSCENYSEELAEVDGERLCPDCIEAEV